MEIRGKKGHPSSSLHANLIGAKMSTPEGLELQTERTNYLIGNDQSRWITGVPNFERVKFAGVYPGIDMVYYGMERLLSMTSWWRRARTQLRSA